VATYETIEVRFQESICFVRIDRPDANNTIDGQLVAECNDVLSACEESATVVVLSGSPEVFCMGADFKALAGAQFSLSELLFGLYPACVLPFLIRRVGFQKAHYLTLMTQPIAAKQACEWGLVDVVEAQSEALLRRHLLRLRRLSKTAIRRYKAYMSRINAPLVDLRSRAVAGNVEVFGDAGNLQGIKRYVEQGVFPWE
jgi:polyketide biosynthesis enoyl-CoA hydratase PksH